MATANVTEWTVEDYDRAAQEYCASLPPEHFMEATPQGFQREITLESLALVKARRRDFHVFNELLVQYPLNAHLGQVVPDNMVVLSKDKPEPEGSYNLPFETAPLFWTLEYVSRKSVRKDYKENFRKYEQELQVPYYLLFYPEKQDLRLYRHSGLAYEQVEPNAQGRLTIPELKIEVALLDGWVRYWYRGELLPLPAELLRELDKSRERIEQLEQRVHRDARRLQREKQRAEQEKQRAEGKQQELDAAKAEIERLQGLLAQKEPGQSGKQRSGKKK